MNKKKLVTGLLSVAFLGGVLVTTALPAEAKDYDGQSTGSVSFKSGGLELPPIDPPIVDPIDPPDSNFGLLYVPKEFNFQATAVPTTPVSAPTVVPIDPNLEGPTGTPIVPPNTPKTNPKTKHFAVGDVRGKRAAGWKMVAKLSDDLKVSASKKLDGATITMKQGINILTPQPTPTPWLSAPTTPSATVHTPDIVIGNNMSNPLDVLTISTTSTLVMSAAKETNPGDADGRGEGYWEGEFTSINLNIPAVPMNAVTAGETYTGTIDWTLTDAI
ncbi:WxL domain-containing protein [Enterococcus hulanensis]|uniref:WxL domain-containing protein n=1 Tax=Enterococcus hulanensis TaxID=2559929 RepID=A0ABU3EZI8_9ENTE|nr:WxL domain-containing protein [Enterococcus hulanensis]MDT2600292.1 WxL domain-containing protein [Enterococcus hulanensis]MDT2609105.1 WxL domain-containing protein [Enterococcus hulanensis]MDT2616853.1 WxL domain-containing protein [Enterococcus hulanensis]MDT2628627.1 WxL domain-containing protein [Enterococcus hulanensis]MDT2655967.1 WxL domain-containing protein [Enterococcus hulanensis]